jgi:hypothetical protein
MMSAGVHVPPMVDIADPIISGAASGSSWTFNAHNPWDVAWQAIVSPLGYVMVHLSCLKCTSQPACVSGDTPTRLVVSEGKMCTCRAASGNPGSGSSAVCVDVITCWLTTLTEMGVGFGLRFGSGVWAKK